MDDAVRKFLEEHHTGAMVTVRPDGSAHVARVTIGLVDGQVWSTGTRNRVRTRHLRVNPRATFFVFDTRSRRWVGLEGKVTIHEGPDAPQKCLAFRRVTGQAPKDEEAFLREMVEVQRVVYELNVERTYGGLEE
jgi:PPOX class probable F420-dependent enzyme